MAVVSPSKRRLFVESRKRPFQESAGLENSKRDRVKMKEAAWQNEKNLSKSDQLLLKVLVPSYAAGAVIGKKGQIIVQLQKDSGAIIKLSKAKDFYPGTQDRVVLIQGTAEAVLKVHCSIVEKVYDFPVPKDLAVIIGDRPKQVKIVVPNSTAGFVIGKSGTTVQTISGESGAKIRLSPKPDGLNVQERIITIKGDKQELLAASVLVIDNIKKDPACASCPNLSYSSIGGPVANSNSAGLPLAVSAPTISDGSQQALHTMIAPYIIPSQQPILQTALPTNHPFSPVQLPGSELSSLNGSVNALTNSPPNFYRPIIVPSRQPHFYSGSVSSHSVLPSAVEFTVRPVPACSFIPASATVPLEEGAALQTSPPMIVSGNYVVNLPPSAFLPSGNQVLSSVQSDNLAVNGSSDLLLETNSHISPSTTSQTLDLAVSSPSLVTELNSEKSADGQLESIELSIPETLIGAILGKAGRTLVEFREISGAKIQISKKGVYVEGTRNRRVTITGKPPCPRTAQALLTERVLSVQASRLQAKFV